MAALASVLLSSPALADVTAEDVWRALLGAATGAGQEVTVGFRETLGDTMVVTRAAFTLRNPQAALSLTIPELRLREVEGRVEITVAGDIPIRLLGRDEDSEVVDLTVTLRHSGLVSEISGNPKQMAHRMAAEEIALTLTDLFLADTTGEITFNLSLSDFEVEHRPDPVVPRRTSTRLTSGGVDYAMSVTDPAASLSVTASGTERGLSGNLTLDLPERIDRRDPLSALRNGLGLSLRFGHSAANHRLSIVEAGDTYAFDWSDQDVSLYAALSRHGFAYDAEAGPASLRVSDPGLPFPLDLTAGALAFSYAQPLAAGADQPMRLALRLIDVAAADSVWAALDPRGLLPRTTLRAVVALDGRMTVSAAPVDPDATGPGLPAIRLDRLDLTELHLSFGGADLVGRGGTAFEGTNPQTGRQRPVGSIDLVLTGGHTLLDRLIATGLLPADVAGGARMVLGLLAMPVGADALASTVEFRRDGSIHANGQPMDW